MFGWQSTTKSTTAGCCLDQPDTCSHIQSAEVCGDRCWIHAVRRSIKLDFRFTVLLEDVWTSAEVIRTAVQFPSALSAEVCWGWPGPRKHPALAPWKISGPQLQDRKTQKKKNWSSAIVFGHEAGSTDPQAAVPCLSLARHTAQQPLP